MKIQLQEHSVRLRIDEDELALLLAGTAVAACTRFAEAFVFAGSVALADADGVSISGSSDAYRITVPAAEVRALAARLPRAMACRSRFRAAVNCGSTWTCATAYAVVTPDGAAAADGHTPRAARPGEADERQPATARQLHGQRSRCGNRRQ